MYSLFNIPSPCQAKKKHCNLYPILQNFNLVHCNIYTSFYNRKYSSGLHEQLCLFANAEKDTTFKTDCTFTLFIYKAHQIIPLD